MILFYCMNFTNRPKHILGRKLTNCLQYTVGENIIGAPKKRNKKGALKMLVFQYCDSNWTFLYCSFYSYLY